LNDRPDSPILQVEDVTLSFGGVKAINGVTFEVAPHTITSIIGPNGAGKTSLFNTISGFYRPDAGTIRFKGESITNLPAPMRARL
jgi:branched-chain amino acid transport system ATP-binding protein